MKMFQQIVHEEDCHEVRFDNPDEMQNWLIDNGSIFAFSLADTILESLIQCDERLPLLPIRSSL